MRNSFPGKLSYHLFYIQTCLPGISFSCVGHPFLFQELSEPTDKRILVLAGALHANYDIDRLYELTKIDKWFLQKFKNITELDKILQQFRGKVRNRTHNIALCNWFINQYIFLQHQAFDIQNWKLE